MRPRPAVLFVATALIAEAGASNADDEAEPIQLEYSAPPGCPDRDAFEAHVRALTGKAHFEVARPGMRTFDVRIEAGTPLRGTMLVHRGDAVEGRRVVQADRCSDVDDALTLMVALAIDPQASLTPVTAGSAAPPPSSSSSSIPSAPSAAASSSAAPAAQPLPPRPPPPPPPPTRQNAPVAQDDSRSGLRPTRPPETLSIGFDLAVASGVAPSMLVGPSPAIEWRSGARSLFAPTLRLAFVRTSSGTFDAGGAAASFTWTVGRLDGCGVDWPPVASLHLLGCARVEAGAIDAVGSDIVGAHGKTTGWFAAGPLMRVEWAFLPPLYVDADVAPMFHVTADRFFFLPNSTIYEVPYAGLEASVGIGVHFL
ncbi:MAG TPA: hypothetical protein VF765_22360 [Polyangiaceae bacterium]